MLCPGFNHKQVFKVHSQMLGNERLFVISLRNRHEKKNIVPKVAEGLLIMLYVFNLYTSLSFFTALKPIFYDRTLP